MTTIQPKFQEHKFSKIVGYTWRGILVSFKVVLRPKKAILFFSLDFKTMLTKHWLTQVLSSDFENTPVYFNWNFLPYWSDMTNFKILRELGRGENDIKILTSLRMQCVCTRPNKYAAWEFWTFRLLNPCFACIINCVYTLKF